MSNKTEIQKISYSDTVDSVEEKLDEDTLSKSIADLSLSLKTRIQALNLFYEKEGSDNTLELLLKLGTMYEMSGTKTLRKYLFAICEESDISPFLKSFVGKALHSYNRKDDLGYKSIDIIYNKLGTDVGTPYKIELVKILMKNEEYKGNARSHFCSTINDQEIDCDYRYKTIIGLEVEIDEKEENEEENKRWKWFIEEGLLEFLNEKRNMTMYRILASQYLLQKTEREREHVENTLLSFATDTELDYNLRADATDVLLQLSKGEIKTRAQEIIMELGRDNRTVRTIYDNAQNVHSVEIEESVKSAIEFLHTFDIMKVGDKGNKREIDMRYWENEVKEMLKEERKEKGIKEDEKYEKEEKIKVAVNRIYMDRAIYSKYSCNLSHIALRVWTYIVGHKSEDAMRKRLLEELEEMAGTCSSGFVSRLVNVISGFGDFSMRISWREQIIGNLTGRLNKRIREMDNLTLQEKVLEQMILETDRYEERKHFLRFLRKNMLSIRQEMHSEFTEHIDDMEFDLYFRAAVSMYETGKFV